jgi:DNA-binding MarR family transcriptional regulator
MGKPGLGREEFMGASGRPIRAWAGDAPDEANPLAMDDFATVRLGLLADVLTRGATQAFESRFGVKTTELRILVQLGGRSALAVNEIARRTRVDKAWISRSIRALERRGLVGRARHPTDTRASLVSLTDKGRALIEALAPVARSRNDRLLKGLDRAEVSRLLDALLLRADDLLRNP